MAADRSEGGREMTTSQAAAAAQKYALIRIANWRSLPGARCHV
jgi:hypothetical protein